MSTVIEFKVEGKRLACFAEVVQPRLFLPMQNLLRGGMSPGSLVWALTLGGVLGCMPLIWGTSLLCLGAALILRFNPLAVQAGNIATWPLQIALAGPYVYLGRIWFASFPKSAERGGGVLHASAAPFHWLGVLWDANGAALCAWGVTAPCLGFFLYQFFRRLVVRTKIADSKTTSNFPS